MSYVTGSIDEREAKRRFEAALRRAMNTPHKPLKQKLEGEAGYEAEEEAQEVSERWKGDARAVTRVAQASGR